MIKFGTGGWRAIIADDFTKTNLRLLTAGLCELMLAQGLAGTEICMGYDRRFLSTQVALPIFCGLLLIAAGILILRSV